MKINQLKSIIQEIVKEEVKKQLPTLLSEVFKSGLYKTKRDIEPTDKIIDGYEKQVNKPIKQFVKDPVLNKILNETVPNLPKEGPSVPVPVFDKIGQVDDGVFGTNSQFTSLKSMLNEDISDTHVSKTAVSDSDSSSPQSVLDVPSVIPDNLKSIFNRDYKSFMKQVDKKKNH